MRLLSILLLSISCVGLSKTLKIQSSKMIRLHGTVDNTMYTNFINDLQKINKNDKELYILINSTGGSIIIGNIIINKIQALKAKKKVICIAEDIAFSMGFMILIACDKIYALSNSQLMFHLPSIVLFPNSYTVSQLKTILAQLIVLEKDLIEKIAAFVQDDAKAVYLIAKKDIIFPVKSFLKFYKKAPIQIINSVLIED